MNYYYIKNKFDKIEYNYPDLFDIKIYYYDIHYCQIIVERLDSEDGWGLELELKIFDINDNNIYDIIKFGNSNYKNKSIFIETKINLEIDYENNIKIPSILYPRNDNIINNNYEILNLNNIDLHLVIYKLDSYKIKIIIRRLDEDIGWDNKLILILYDNNIINRKEIINIGNSNNNFMCLVKNTKIEINHDNDYVQQIPKIIIQTGYNNNLKNILHFNSIMTFIELNPEYTYIYYNDINGRKFLKDHFTDETNYAYDMLVPGAFKADLLRYCILYIKGGCYFDCKQILRVSIRKFLDFNKSIVLCNDIIDNAILNATILSNKSHIIMEKTIKDCTYNVINRLGKSALDITGPTFLFKSIKKFINNDNIIFQNNRPFNNFNNFANDYLNNNIKLISNNKIILNRYYKDYYNNYLDINHYGKLFENNEVYYKNFQNINNIKICIYPNKSTNKFLFTLKNNQNNSNKHTLIIKRIDSNDGWNFNLKILIINQDFKDFLFEIGSFKKNKKEIIIDLS
jgi:mannosyltransferase OCH1-like enzyme